MVAVGCDRGSGVPVGELRAAVSLARLSGDGGGLAWPAAVWERLWGRLTPMQQRVVYNHLLLGMSHADTAESVGLSRGSVDGLWRRAIDRMRDAVPPPN